MSVYKIYIAEAYGATSIVVCIYRDWGVNAYGATSIVVCIYRDWDVNAYGATSIVVCTFSLAHIFVATMICSVVFGSRRDCLRRPSGKYFCGQHW